MNAPFVLAPRWIVPVESPPGLPEVLHGYALVVEHGAIRELLPVADARARYSALAWTELPRHALIPGLINLHCHAAMSLMRGFADDLPLMRWLGERIWPAEKAHLAAGFVRGLVASIADPEPALERWRHWLVHRPGDRIAVRVASGAVESGRFAGLTEEGFLRLDQGSGERVISGGDVIES